MADSATIKIGDYSDDIIKSMQRQLQNGLLACGTIAEGYAKEECPVDTGRLRNSITNSVQTSENEAAVYIGTNVEYAPQVEFMDISHKTGNAHFLKNAVTNHTEEYEKTIEAALKS